MIACTAAALAFAFACGCGEGSRGAPEAVVFRSLVPEYYRRYYALANTQTVQPGEEYSGAEAARLEGSLRRVSLAWAQAREDTLTFVGQEFTYYYRAFAKTPKGTRYLEYYPSGNPTILRGTWSRRDQHVVLRIREAGDLPRSKPLEWIGTWREDEIVLPWGFDMGPLAGEVILRRTAP